ncbi:hypothetical protein R5R35_004962 [Gryllus longicercus]|uniref:Uncharacterized protein n=1 Tax=Gryllus longicercus TaxID=2509291 RepID=A0AAN9Z8A8_9ORTH
MARCGCAPEEVVRFSRGLGANGPSTGAPGDVKCFRGFGGVEEATCVPEEPPVAVQGGQDGRRLPPAHTRRAPCFSGAMSPGLCSGSWAFRRPRRFWWNPRSRISNGIV